MLEFTGFGHVIFVWVCMRAVDFFLVCQLCSPTCFWAKEWRGNTVAVTSFFLEGLGMAEYGMLSMNILPKHRITLSQHDWIVQSHPKRIALWLLQCHFQKMIWIPEDSSCVFSNYFKWVSCQLQFMKICLCSNVCVFVEFFSGRFRSVTMLKPQWLLHSVVEMNQKFKCRHLNSFYFWSLHGWRGFLPAETIHAEYSLPIGLSLNHQQPEFRQWKRAIEFRQWKGQQRVAPPPKKKKKHKAHFLKRTMGVKSFCQATNNPPTTTFWGRGRAL